ncbi:MAG: (2Fe-2S)-binding protein [Sphingobacteriaceae bacterium]|nr:(2Fe-2S)-binding protein [Sphingobacteriaceae bacterium]MBK7816959.1 (2Fe-2S)-binding protein [Sphingobacteriaceae bacterium]
MSDIKINIQNPNGTVKTLLGPTDMGLSLMEFLKANEYDILATCGGMALCATCHVEVISGFDVLGDICTEEYAMLDTLPNITDKSRLSCQLRLTPNMDGITVKIMGDGLS